MKKNMFNEDIINFFNKHPEINRKLIQEIIILFDNSIKTLCPGCYSIHYSQCKYYFLVEGCNKMKFCNPIGNFIL